MTGCCFCGCCCCCCCCGLCFPKDREYDVPDDSIFDDKKPIIIEHMSGYRSADETLDKKPIITEPKPVYYYSDEDKKPIIAYPKSACLSVNV